MPARRRIVTGHTGDGVSTVVSDHRVEPHTSPGLPGVELLYLWGADEPAGYPDRGVQPDWHQHFPPEGGFRFVTYQLPPADAPVPPDSTSDTARAHARESFPGLLETYHDGGSGLHASDTTDLAIVLSGEVVLGMTDGSEHVLRTGDTVVQNGTTHSWTNRTTDPVEMLFVLVGARREA